MRRLLLLAVCGIIFGKFFAGAFVSLTKSTSIGGPHFNIDKTLDENMKLAPIPDANMGGHEANTSLRARELTLKSPLKNTLTAMTKPPVIQDLAAKKTQAKELEDSKRRKKRKKALEEKLSKATPPETPKQGIRVSQVQVSFPQRQSPQSEGFQGLMTAPKTNANSALTTAAAPANQGPVYTSNGGGQAAVAINGWMDALVHRPTDSLMRGFLALYSKKQITDAQFYSVLNAMQKSQVLTARQYAVEVVGNQQRFESFEILAEEAQTETDSALKSQASQDLTKTYGGAQGLPTLLEALTSGGVNVKLEALSLLSAFVQNPSTTHNTTVTSSYLASFIPLIDPLTREPSPAELHADATAALHALTAFLQTTT